MVFRYTIPEISAITLLSAIEEKDGKCDIVYDAAEPSREYLVKWTRQDDCPMFHQAKGNKNKQGFYRKQAQKHHRSQI